MGTHWFPPQSTLLVHTMFGSFEQTLFGAPVASAKIFGFSKVTSPPSVRPDMQAGGENVVELSWSSSMLALLVVDSLTTFESSPPDVPPQTWPNTRCSGCTPSSFTLKPGLDRPLGSSGQSPPASSKLALKFRSRQRAARLQSPDATALWPKQGGVLASAPSS